MSPNDTPEKPASQTDQPPENPSPGQPCRDDAIMTWLSEPLPTDSPGESSEIFQAELVEPPAPPPAVTRKRRRLLPLCLFLLTCASTFLAGACRFVPFRFLIDDAIWKSDLMPWRRVMIANWDEGLIYMACVLAILLTHEMGHFIATLWHRIPASYPFFLPLPVSPLGTLGAVIGMDGLRANRRQMFDIGIAGPLAGLVVAIPILLIGVDQLDFNGPRYGEFKLDNPLLVKLLLRFNQPEGYTHGEAIWHGQLNPYFMAGWVGLLITGLNMLPVSQLDGGHVTYTLFGRTAHWIARGFMLVAVGWILLSGYTAFLLMIVLIMLVGTDHPPTSDDQMPLGWFRTTLGCLSLIIPVLCFAPRAIYF